MSAPRRTKRSAPRVACDPAMELKARLAALEAFAQALFGDVVSLRLQIGSDHCEAMLAGGAESSVTAPWTGVTGYQFPGKEHVTLTVADGRVEAVALRDPPAILPAEEKAS